MCVCSQWTGAFRPRSVDTSTYASPTLLLGDGSAGGTAASSVDVVGHAGGGGTADWLVSSDREAADPTPKGNKKRQKTDIALELSNLVVYTQAVKFRGQQVSRHQRRS